LHEVLFLPSGAGAKGEQAGQAKKDKPHDGDAKGDANGDAKGDAKGSVNGDADDDVESNEEADKEAIGEAKMGEEGGSGALRRSSRIKQAGKSATLVAHRR